METYTQEQIFKAYENGKSKGEQDLAMQISLLMITLLPLNPEDFQVQLIRMLKPIIKGGIE